MDDEFVEYATAGWSRLAALAVRITGDTHAAQDLVQEALALTWAGWSRVRNKDRPDGYVLRTMIRLYLQHQRRFAAHEQLMPLVADGTDGGVARRVAGPLADPVTDQVDERHRVWAAIQRLPARQKLVVVLRYYEDLSEMETAAVLGCAPGTVKSQLFKAMAHLRAALGTASGAERGAGSVGQTRTAARTGSESGAPAAGTLEGR
jgi:RNA polymerase sigma-70 factor (sigma-E family)